MTNYLINPPANRLTTLTPEQIEKLGEISGAKMLREAQQVGNRLLLSPEALAMMTRVTGANLLLG